MPKKKSQIPEEKRFPEAWEDLFAASDRAAAIVGQAMLDEILRRLLVSYLIAEEGIVSELLNPKKETAPLGSSYHKTLVAYGLGLLSKEEFDDLTVIRQIRNRFAHEMNNMTFADEEVLKLFQKLTMMNRGRIVKTDFRAIFGFSIANLIMSLEKRVEVILAEKDGRRELMKEICEETSVTL